MRLSSLNAGGPRAMGRTVGTRPIAGADGRDQTEAIDAVRRRSGRSVRPRSEALDPGEKIAHEGGGRTSGDVAPRHRPRSRPSYGTPPVELTPLSFGSGSSELVEAMGDGWTRALRRFVSLIYADSPVARALVGYRRVVLRREHTQSTIVRGMPGGHPANRDAASAPDRASSHPSCMTSMKIALLLGTFGIQLARFMVCAASCWSTSQMKPTSSRATATAATLACLPR